MMRIYAGHACDVLRTLPADRVQCCVTSPPYFGLRSYGTRPIAWPDGWQGHLGLEPTPLLYIQHLVAIFGEVRRVLRPDGVCWINIGDSYAWTGKSGGSIQGKRWELMGAKYIGPRGGKWCPPPLGMKQKSLMLIPQRLAIALQEDGWIVRQVFPWVKRNAMPGSQTDRATSALEWWLMLTKSPRYFCDMEAVRQPQVIQSQEELTKRCGTYNYYEQSGGDAKGFRGKMGGETGARFNPQGRTYRNTDLWIQSLAAPYGLVGVGEELVGLDVPTQGYAGDHYATFPVELIEPLLRMGTSAHGACSACGAPWQRNIARGASSWDARKAAGHPMRYGNAASGQHQGHGQIQHARPLEGGLGFVAPKTMQGWQPSCLHTDAPRVPCVVLDPFLGRATTLLAAQRLGLRGIGIELNPQDIVQASTRLRAAAPLLAQIHVVQEAEEPT